MPSSDYQSAARHLQTHLTNTKIDYMVFNGKSIKQQNDKTINHGPASIFQSLAENYQKLFLYALGKQTTHKDSCYATQDTIASDLGISPKTIQRGTHVLEDLGLFYVQRRIKESSVIVIPQLILQNEGWRGFLRGICAWIPPVVLNLSLLSSSASTCDRLQYIKRDEKYPKGISLSRSGLNSLSISVILKEGLNMGSEAPSQRTTPDAEKINEVKKICAALMKRGSYMTNDLALGFIAFDLDVLQRASQKMKARKDVQSPAAYFNTLCREITIQDGRKPDWVTVHKLRESGLVLIEKADEVPVIERPVKEKTKETQKVEQQATSYSEQVRKTIELEKQAAEDRKSKHGSLEEELVKWDKQIADMRPGAETNPILAATLAYAERCRSELIAKLTSSSAGPTADRPNTPQISTEKKEVASTPLQVGSWKQIDPIGSLKPVLPTVERAPISDTLAGTYSEPEWNPTEADELYDPDIYEE